MRQAVGVESCGSRQRTNDQPPTLGKLVDPMADHRAQPPLDAITHHSVSYHFRYDEPDHDRAVVEWVAREMHD